MRNLTFKAAMLKGSQPTVNRQSTDGQSQRHCKQTPLSKRWKVLMTLVFLFTFAIGNVWAAAHSITPNKTGTNYEIYQIAHQNNQSGTVIKSKQSTFNDEFTSWCSGSIYDYAGSTPTIPSAIADNWLAQTTKGAKVRQPGLTFEVTNCVGVTILGKANGSGESKKWTLSVKSGGVEVGTVASDNTTSVHELSYGTTLSATETYTITVASSGASSNIELYQIRFEAPSTTTKYSVTYKAGDGTGDDVVDSDAKTVKAFADCSFTAPTGYEFKEWQDAGSTVVAAGGEVKTDMTLTAIYRLIPTKYTVTYNLNGPSGDAPTETSKAKDDVFTLAAAPSWAGHAFDGWLCNIDSDVKAAGSSYTMTAANTTFTAQWTELDCKIFSLTGGIGSAEKTADNAAVTAGESLVLSNTSGRIKLTPAAGETFKTGDVITISGTIGNGSTADFGVYVYGTNGSTEVAQVKVANSVYPRIATATFTKDADYVYLKRYGGTTTTMLTFEVHRACAEGVAAGLAYATAEVAKTEGDAAFTNPLTNANSLVVAGYSSSNTAVATVDKAGQVTIVAPGTATITAHSAVQTKAGTLYAAGTATYTLNVAALPKYHVVYDLKGGSGEVAEVDHKAGEKFNLHDGVTGITAPTNKTFINWKDQDDALFDGGAEYTMPAKDVTLTAQWAGDVYTVKFMDGETLLDTKVVEVGSNPTDIEHPTKQMFTFAAWQKEGVDIALDDESWTSVAKDAEITLTVLWAKAYANSVDFVKKITDDGTSGWAAYLEANNYYIASTEGVSFDNNNAFDTGLKMKNTIGNTLSFTAAAGKVIDLTVGNISGMTIAINGGEASPITSGTDATHLGVTHYYADGDQEVVLTETVTGYNIIRQITIRDPFTVSFDANGGEDVASLNGTPSIILPSASKGTDSFLGWYYGDTKIGEAGDEYTPTDDIELKAHWESVSTDARLASITFSAAGTLSPTFDPEVTTYTYTMPYKTAAIPTITGATSVNANAQDPEIVSQASAWNETAVIRGVAQSGDKKTYNITMKVAPKDPISIIETKVTSQNNHGPVGGLIGGDAAVKNASTFKLNKGNYVGVTLAGSNKFQAGDVVAINVTNVESATGFTLYSTNDVDSVLIIDTRAGVLVNTGINYVTIPATYADGVTPYEGTSSIYLLRANNDYTGNMNPRVDSIAVLRAMNPVLKSITFDGTKINVTSTTVSETLPYGADLADVAPEIVWNGAGTAVVTTNSGNWAWGENTYVLTDKDGDATTYTITLTEAEHYVAQIGTTGYTSLEAALAHAADGEIVLLEDIDVTAQIEIAAGVTATIDLAGHKIEYTGTETLPSGVILVHNGASLTINDSSDPDAGKIVAGNKAYAAIAMTKLGDDPANAAVLVINGGIFTGYYYAITGNGSRHNTEITINGGTITATADGDNQGIYHPQQGTLTVNGGTITAISSAIEMRAGTLNITGGTFTATATDFSCDPNGNGTTTIGAAIAIAQHTTKKDIAVTINGGTFTGVKALNESNPQVNDPAPAVAMSITDGDFTGAVSTVDVHEFISGGTYDAPVASENCAEGYMPKDNGDGSYGVQPKDPMCLIKVELSAPDDNTVATPTITVGYGNTEVGGNVKGTKTHETIVGYKFNADGAYLYVTLANGSFQAGDSVEVYMTYGAKALVVYPHYNSAALATSAASASATLGKNYVVLAEGADTLYLARNGNGWNPNVAYIAVYRVANPMLQKFELAGEAGVINEAAKTVAVEVPYATNVTALEPTLAYITNDNAQATVSPAGAQDFSSPVVYTITDKDGSTTSYTVTVSIAEPSTDATLSALSYGGTAIALEDGVYDYIVNLAKGTTVVPALAATAHSAVAQTPVIDNATEFVNYQATSSVVVTAQNGTTTQTYTVLFKVAHSITALVDVTENTVWDWTTITARADGSEIDEIISEKKHGPRVATEDGLILANYVLGGDNWDKIEGNNTAYAIRNTDNKYYQGASLHMHTTVSGYLKIHARNDGSSMTLNVQNAGRDMEIASLGNWAYYTVYVQAGDVVIYNVPASGTKPMRIDHMEFKVDNTPDYTRTEMLGNGVYGTICLPYNVPAGGVFGVTIYELMGREPQYGKLAFDEIVSGEMEAGVPYVFQAHSDALSIFYGETHVDDPVSKDNGMYGTFTNQTLTDLDDVYYFAQRALWSCDDLTELNLPANRAYVKLSEIDYLTDPNPAPGRRRITMTVNGEKVTTGIGEIETSETPMKVLIDGQIFIIRGEKMFDVTGKLVK